MTYVVIRFFLKFLKIYTASDLAIIQVEQILITFFIPFLIQRQTKNKSWASRDIYVCRDSNDELITRKKNSIISNKN